MDFDKAKFLTLSPKSQQKLINELSQIMKETSVADYRPSTPPQQIMETKRALQSPETPHQGGRKKITLCFLQALTISILK